MTPQSNQQDPGYLILADLKKPFSCTGLFDNDNPVELEIGAGRGDFLVGFCQANPDVNLLAVERKLNYLMRGVNKVRQQEITNARFLNLEAFHFVEEYVLDASLQAVHIYFPDPWPKKRHLKRRLVQSAFIKLLAQKVVSGGKLHLRTDHSHYFEHMMEVMGAQKYFTPIEVPQELIEFKTGFERRFEEDGLPINRASYILSQPAAD